MKNQYNSMESLNEAVTIQKLEADIAEQRLINHWKTLKNDVQQDGNTSQLVWQALTQTKALGFLRSQLLGSIAGTAIEFALRRFLFKRRR